MLRTIGRRAKTGFAVIGFAAVTGGVLASQAAQRMQKEATQLPDHFVLELDLEASQLVETKSPFNPVSLLSPGVKQLELRKVVRALKEAGEDERIRSLVAYLGDSSTGMGLAVTEELRGAVQTFRSQSKDRATQCIAFGSTFGEAGSGGTATYYLASAFEKVYMQPTALLSLTGFVAQGTFFKGLLDKWQVKSHVSRREEYKSAVEPFIEEKYSRPAREALQQLLQSMLGTVAQGIADSRGISPKLVQSAIDEAPLSAQRAQQYSLLDGIKYRDEVLAEAVVNWPAKQNGDAASGAPKVDIAKYIRVLEAKDAKKQRNSFLSLLRASKDDDADDSGKTQKTPEVAVVHAEGPIYPGGTPQQSTSTQIDAAKLCSTLQQIRDSNAVKAVVLRIDSPGGSAVASDTIHREVTRLREAGKLVVVSMGNVAASGGYFIAAPADKIVAQPTTITGSIGVLFGKLNIAPGLRQVGVATDIVSVGENAAAMSPFTDFSPAQQKQVDARVEDVYQDFLQKVASGRKLTPQATRTAAKGRVWSGTDALKLGLIDRLGGLQDAIALARKEAELPEEEGAVSIVDYPKPKSRLELVLKALSGEPMDMSTAAALLSQGGLSSQAASLLALAAGSSSGLQLVSSQSGFDPFSAAQMAAGHAAASVGASSSAQPAAAAASGACGSGPQMVCNVRVF